MHARVLIVSDHQDFARLIEHHLSVFWPDAETTHHAPLSQGEFHPAFAAAAFDAVVLDEQSGAGRGTEWLTDLAARADFPPIIYCAAAPDENGIRALQRLGASEVLRRSRIDNRRFASIMRHLHSQRQRARQAARARPEAEDSYRFGPVTIRGQRFIQEIGKGGTSHVYLAENEKAGEVVVLKVIGHNPETAENPDGFDRFLQEYEVVSRIRHPNVVKIFDLGVADDHAYIAMEYFAGGDLRKRMNESIPAAETVMLAEQIARALEAIHAVGVMHRDLKPGNIMFRADGSLALIDFGLAKQLTGGIGVTAAGEIFGTPYYMSPEQGHGEPVDIRSDLYSLGVILYEMLTRKKPYMSTSVMNVIYLHRNAPLPELPENLGRFTPLVHRLLAKSPDDRFQSATQLLADLDRLRA